MYQRKLKKPDGRAMHLYSRRPIPEGIAAPSPNSDPLDAQPYLRWNPLRGEWVAYASHRQNRTFLPPPEYNPLAPMQSESVPTEMPRGDYDIAVFDNLFPALARSANQAPEFSVPTGPACGACEVVVFTQDPKASLGGLELSQIELLLEVWGQRTREIAQNRAIHVMPFENRGVEMGVTLHHPHGQIYSYPFVPPVAERELAEQKKYFDKKGRGLLEDMVIEELKEDRRVLFSDDRAIAFVPVCARYPYEVWLMPRQPIPHLYSLLPEDRVSLAKALKTVLLKYDGLWNRAFPYLMVVHQAPTDGRPHPEAHLHFEFYPAYRAKDRLKYLAGTELGAGMFANDSIPEEKARELKAVEIKLE